jgi:hypothetical protein
MVSIVLMGLKMLKDKCVYVREEKGGFSVEGLRFKV